MQELQRKYAQLQLLKQQLNTLLEEKMMIDERVAEIVNSMDALKNLEKVKEGDEIWSGLGSGSFLNSAVKDTAKVLVSVGAGILIKEDRARAIEILQSRLDELNKIDKELVAEINKFSDQASKTESELQKLAEDEEKKKPKQ